MQSLAIFEDNYHLDIQKLANQLRKTHIICTLGPACHNVEKLQQMMGAGMDIARLNFSHGSYEYHSETIQLVREAQKLLGPVSRPIAIALDTKGPEIRTGLINGSPTEEVELQIGKIIRITPNKAYSDHSDEKTLYVDYENIVHIVNVGSSIYIDDGLICVRVKEKGSDFLDCVIVNGGKLGSKKGVNLPGSPVDLPAMSEKDKKDILFAVENNLDMIFASFIRDAKSIYEMRELMGEKGAHIKIIAKIENHQGVNNIKEIIEAADGIMMARGDLGIEIPPEKVFLVQKRCFALCNVVGKPCICATQMLESMTHKPRATRAESSDVANAVLDGADCVMLSGETAKGQYPIECIQTMAAICREAEAVITKPQIHTDLRSKLGFPADNTFSAAVSAVAASYQIDAQAIICLTTTGKTAKMLAMNRPCCPILCVTCEPSVARQLYLNRGCIPILYEEKKGENWTATVNHRIGFAVKYGYDINLLHNNDYIVIVTGWRDEPGHTNTIQIVQTQSKDELKGLLDLKPSKR